MSSTSPNVVRLTAEQGGVRLDKFVASARADLSRMEVQRLIKAGEVRVNGRTEKASYRLEAGDEVELVLPEPETPTIQPEAVELDVLYEDDDLVAVNKPAGMVTHPAYGNWSGTLVNAALYHWPQMRDAGPDLERSGVVHRLDKDTSGVIVLAKTPQALRHLQRQFKRRTVYKLYTALVEGVPASNAGIIEAPIGRDPSRRKRMAVVKGGRPAITRYDLIEDLETNALLAVEPRTGRTHQIRVHLAWLGHPIVGDRLYGYRKQRIGLKRLFLHASELHVDSPSTGERLEFRAPLPAGLEDILAKLRRNLPSAW
ncbi:MAG: RluA family pseudouridine synthase [Aggregatilineales bacterium]|nr:RluA family pseudouridine synthase [Chloroflexota bacterium]HOA23049.1 RluA family pseudouridine synthase [Aggregatilineales bacterium]HPV07602.1 RluA family pseudouridine synthase [Aggregatilineales bacterium]HQE16890.1 RluA family pseudouridine synthase [Aggregatilineales bacterium]